MVCSQAAERIVGARFATCHRSDGADPNADGTLTVHAVEKPAERDPPDALNQLSMDDASAFSNATPHAFLYP
jgi:hypothetical protein